MSFFYGNSETNEQDAFFEFEFLSVAESKEVTRKKLVNHEPETSDLQAVQICQKNNQDDQRKRI